MALSAGVPCTAGKQADAGPRAAAGLRGPRDDWHPVLHAQQPARTGWQQSRRDCEPQAVLSPLVSRSHEVVHLRTREDVPHPCPWLVPPPLVPSVPAKVPRMKHSKACRGGAAITGRSTIPGRPKAAAAGAALSPLGTAATKAPAAAAATRDGGAATPPASGARSPRKGRGGGKAARQKAVEAHCPPELVAHLHDADMQGLVIEYGPLFLHTLLPSAAVSSRLPCVLLRVSRLRA